MPAYWGCKLFSKSSCWAQTRQAIVLRCTPLATMPGPRYQFASLHHHVEADFLHSGCGKQKPGFRQHRYLVGSWGRIYAIWTGRHIGTTIVLASSRDRPPRTFVVIF